MKAWRVHGVGEPADVLRLDDVPEPEPGPGQRLVRVVATGLGLPDVFMCRGTYAFSPTIPFSPGQEVCGIDVATGERVMGVTDFSAGHGGYAELTLLNDSTTFPVPDGLDDAEASGFWIPHLTAWVGLVVRGGIRPGDRLVVLGAAGSSGTAAVRLGKALGAQVVAVASGEEKAAFCRALGADETFDSGAVAEAAKGADVVYDPVGGDAGAAAAHVLAPGGRLLAVGFASGSWPVVDVHRLVRRNASLVGVFAGGFTRDQLDDMHASLSALVPQLGGQVTTRFAFEDLPAGLTQLAARQTIGKSVLLSSRSTTA